MLEGWSVTNLNGNRFTGKPERKLRNTFVSDISSESQVVSPEKKKKKTRLSTFKSLVSKFQGHHFKVWKSGDTVKYPKLEKSHDEFLMTFKYKGDVNFYIKGQDKLLRKQKEEVSDVLVIVGVARDVEQKERNYRLFIDQYSKAFGLFHESSSDSSDESSDVSNDEVSVESLKQKKSVRAILRKFDSEPSDNEEEESDEEETNGK